jgi:hypothetical protein
MVIGFWVCGFGFQQIVVRSGAAALGIKSDYPEHRREELFPQQSTIYNHSVIYILGQKTKNYTYRTLFAELCHELHENRSFMETLSGDSGFLLL